MTKTLLNSAKKALENHQIIAIPTETVYGLAGNAYNETEIKKIFELKKRPFYNPLIVHIKNTAALNTVACQIPDMAFALANEFWPGSLTLVLKKQSHIPKLITAGKDTVAVRVPNHWLTLALLEQLNFPLAAPSANPFGAISPTTAQHVMDYFKENLEIILDGGECQSGLESTIIRFENNKAVLYRHGSIAIEAIEIITGPLQIHASNDTSPEAPGMLTRHYAPNTTTILTENIQDHITFFKNKKIGLLLFKDKIYNQEIVHQ